MRPGYSLDRDGARRVSAVVRRVEGYPVNDPADPPRPRDQSSYAVRVSVTSATPTGGLYPCVWSWLATSDNTWQDEGEAWAIPTAGVLALGGGLGLLVGEATDGLCIFAVQQGGGGGLSGGTGNSVQILTSVDFFNCVVFGFQLSGHVELNGINYPITLAVE